MNSRAATDFDADDAPDTPPDPTMLAIGQNIRRAREAAGLTQLGLATRTEYTQSAVSDWENGRRVPGGLMMRRLAEILDVSTDELLGL